MKTKTAIENELKELRLLRDANDKSMFPPLDSAAYKEVEDRIQTLEWVLKD